MDSATANRLVLIFLFLTILITPAKACNPDTLTVTYLEIGEADAILVQA